MVLDHHTTRLLKLLLWAVVLLVSLCGPSVSEAVSDPRHPPQVTEDDIKLARQLNEQLLDGLHESLRLNPNRPEQFTADHFWFVLFRYLAQMPSQLFHNHFWQQRPVLIRGQSLFNDILVTEYGQCNTIDDICENEHSSVAQGLLDYDTVKDILTRGRPSTVPKHAFAHFTEWHSQKYNDQPSSMPTKAFYENPYMIFSQKNKLEAPSMNSWNFKLKNYTFTSDMLKDNLKKHTLVLNNAGLYFTNVTWLERVMMSSFRIPVNTNAYVSGLRQSDLSSEESTKSKKKKKNQNQNGFSSTVHSDRQDVFIVQTEGDGLKRWVVWDPLVRHPRFEQIRGKDEDNLSSDSGAVKKLKVWYNVTLNVGDVLYIPRGFLHEVSMAQTADAKGTSDSDSGDPKNEEIKESDGNENTQSIHLSMGLELDTLGFTIESMLFCAMGVSAKESRLARQSKEQSEVVNDHMDYQSILTYLSGLLWQWSYDKEELRRTYPIGFDSFQQHLWQPLIGDDDYEEYLGFNTTEHRVSSVDDMKHYNQMTNAERKGLIDAFLNRLLDLIDEFDYEICRKARDFTENDSLKPPTVEEKHLFQAHDLFQNGLNNLMSVFSKRLEFALVKESQWMDPIRRNEEFDDKMLEAVMDVFVRCGVPVNVVNDGDETDGYD